MNHQMNIDEAIAIAKEYHLETEVTECIKLKLINIITQNIILLGCCAISIFILFVLITFIKNVDDFAAITNMYDYIRMQNITIKIDTIIFKTIVILSLSRINNAI